MPAIGFDESQRSHSIFDTDQLKLEYNEVARVVILSKQFEAEYAHYIRTGEGDQARGRYYQCLGNYDVMRIEGTDPDTCPACAVASPDRSATVPQARRRFACYIARYQTNTKGELPRGRVSLTLQVWIFGDDKYNKLHDRFKEHGQLALVKDLIIKCTAKQYQNFDIDVSPRAPLYQADKDAVAQMKDVLKEMKPTKDLARVLCQPMTREALERMLDNSPSITADEAQQTVDAAVADFNSTFDDEPAVSVDAETPVNFDADMLKDLGVNL